MKKIKNLRMIMSILPLSLLSNNETFLTVYNNNLGFVKENKVFEIKNNNEQIIKYDGIASTVITDSVIPSFSFPVKLYSQNYFYDVFSFDNLLKAHIGKEIKIKDYYNNDNYEIKTVKLISTQPITVEYIDGSLTSFIEPKNIILDKDNINNELSLKPSLQWEIIPNKTGLLTIDLNYLIKNISWKSDYNILFNNNKLNLNGWVTIDNKSGKNYKDTNLKVIAGEINQNQQHYQKNMMISSSRSMSDSMEVTQESMSGYHLYTIPFLVNIKNNEKKQFNFINLENIQAKKINKEIIDLHTNYQKVTPNQYILFNNKDTVLPRGNIRVYSNDSKNETQFIGENRINHTTKNQNIEVLIGKNTDILITNNILSNKKIDSKTYFLDYNILIENESEEEQTIVLVLNTYNNSNISIKNSNCEKSLNCSYEIKNIKEKEYTIVIDKNSKFNLIESLIIKIN